MRLQDLVKCQILGAVHNAAAQSEGDAELREFAGMVASRFGGPVDLIHKGFKRVAQNQKATMK